MSCSQRTKTVHPLGGRSDSNHLEKVPRMVAASNRKKIESEHQGETWCGENVLLGCAQDTSIIR